MKQYTKQEDEIITNCIKSNISNLREGFNQASLQLTNRNAEAICKRWYKKLRANVNILELKSSIQSINNYKNVNKTISQPNFKSEVVNKLVNSLTPDQKINLLKELIK